MAEITGCNHFFIGQDHFCNGLDIFVVCGRFFSGQDHFVVANKITFSVADTSLLVAKMVAEIPFKVAVVISSVAKISFVVTETTFNVVVITSSVADISLLVTKITCFLASADMEFKFEIDDITLVAE